MIAAGFLLCDPRFDAFPTHPKYPTPCPEGGLKHLAILPYRISQQGYLRSNALKPILLYAFMNMSCLKDLFIEYLGPWTRPQSQP